MATAVLLQVQALVLLVHRYTKSWKRAHGATIERMVSDEPLPRGELTEHKRVSRIGFLAHVDGGRYAG
jgi:hypothetical protein